MEWRSASRVEIIEEETQKSRIQFLDLLNRRVISGLYSKFDSLSPGIVVPDSVRVSVVRAAARFVLIRIRSVHCRIEVRFGTSMQTVTQYHFHIEADVPESHTIVKIIGWNQFIEDIMESAHMTIAADVNSAWKSAISNKKAFWRTIQGIVGSEVLDKLKEEIESTLEREHQRALADKDELKAVDKFHAEHHEDQLQKFRNWAQGHVNANVLSREDFMFVYDELLVRDVMDS